VSKKEAGIELAKALGQLASHAVAPGLLSAFTLLKQGPDALSAYNQRTIDDRYDEFCRSALEGRVFPENAEAMTADHLMAMLRLCLADMEQEKASLYGKLASAIGANQVPSHLAYPLMLALAALTHTQVQRLRGAQLASNFKLIPAEGSGSKSIRTFLGEDDGEAGQWDHFTLQKQSLVIDGALSTLGTRLIEACFLPSELVPSAIGERVWEEGHLPIVSYDMGNADVDDVATRLMTEARTRGIHTGGVAGPRNVNASKSLWFDSMPVFVVIVGPEPGRLVAHRDIFDAAAAQRAKAIIVYLGDRSAEVDALFPNAAIFTGADRNIENAILDVTAEVLRTSQVV
jgi:hypothetical protein